MNKKSNKADLEKNKGLFLTTGLVVALLLVLIIVEHKKKVNDISDNYTFMGEPEFFYTLNIIEDTLETPKPNKLYNSNIDINKKNNYTNNYVNKSSVFLNKKNEDYNGEKNQEYDEEPVFFTEKPAKFPGGDSAFNSYVKNNLHYPEKAKKDSVQGRVYVCFTVCSNGKIKSPKVVNSSNDLLNEEALRLIRSMPAWHAAETKGKPIASKRTVPIIFFLKSAT